MSKKKESVASGDAKKGVKDIKATSETLNSAADLKEFLLSIRDKLADKSAAPVYAVTAMNHIMTLPNIYDMLSAENKEIARDVWLRLKQAGLQIKSPPMLFSPEEDGAAAL